MNLSEAVVEPGRNDYPVFLFASSQLVGSRSGFDMKRRQSCSVPLFPRLLG
jgi:hypothetical protein